MTLSSAKAQLKGVTDAARITPAVRDAYRAVRYRLNRGTRARNASMPREPDGVPLPPVSLVYRVSGHYDLRAFFESGRANAADLRQIAAQYGRPLEACGALLDFGCGAGRVLRHWRVLTRTRVVGTDRDPACVDWCREHLPFAEVRLNGLSGSLPYADATFDFVYALSVFTHLSEDVQATWMAELARVVSPGGLLVFTTQGTGYRHRLTGAERERFESGLLVVQGARFSGRNACSVYHPESYVRHRLVPSELEILDHGGVRLTFFHQTVTVARRR